MNVRCGVWRSNKGEMKGKGDARQMHISYAVELNVK